VESGPSRLSQLELRLSHTRADHEEVKPTLRLRAKGNPLHETGRDFAYDELTQVDTLLALGLQTPNKRAVSRAGVQIYSIDAGRFLTAENQSPILPESDHLPPADTGQINLDLRWLTRGERQSQDRRQRRAKHLSHATKLAAALVSCLDGSRVASDDMTDW
jgi:hypothetical protein